MKKYGRKSYSSKGGSRKFWNKARSYGARASGAALGFIGGNLPGAVAGYYAGKWLAKRSKYGKGKAYRGRPAWRPRRHRSHRSARSRVYRR